MSITRARSLIILTVMMLVVAGAPSRAADCSDILRNGTMKTSHYQESTYLQQIIYARFASMTKSQVRQSREFGLDVPIGDVVLGTNYSDDDIERKQEQIKSSLDYTYIKSHQLDIAMTSGDEVIANAWRACMANLGGLSAIFSIGDSKTIFLKIQFHPALGLNSANLSDDVYIPAEVKVRTNNACLKKGYPVTSAGCVIQLEFPDAQTAIGVALSANPGGTATAFLAPRLKFAAVARPFAFGPHTNPEATMFTNRGDVNHSLRVALEPADIESGWRLLPASARARVILRNTTTGRPTCRNAEVEADRFSALFKYNFSMPGDEQVFCDFYTSIDKEWGGWIPIDKSPSDYALHAGPPTRRAASVRLLPNPQLHH